MIAPELIAEILGLGASVRTVTELESAVSAGLPKRSLERLSTSDRRWTSFDFRCTRRHASWRPLEFDGPSSDLRKLRNDDPEPVH